MEQHEISKAVIRRLPRYYRYLGDLMDAGVERISSAELSAKMNVTASQIRQDLNNFGGFGQQGYGYNVKYLYSEIAKILGLDNVHNLVIIGAGKLGQAIANYSSFEKRGFIIKAMFDNNKDYFGRKVGNIEIMDVNLLADYLTKNNIDIAAITVPKEAVNPIADILVKCGIKSVWNFAPVDLELPEGIIVENVHLLDSLMQLSYNLTEYEHTR
ncbi:MAG: redox-sensing transcriptional repressor Rex [Lachnospiraceae bacterium]|nr:redox-sensing transcriptional repressor Rex [Lachnospiraceae bacterium]